jgi:predicted deacylase/glutamine amidotransferase-like uncharacterized protein
MKPRLAAALILGCLALPSLAAPPAGYLAADTEWQTPYYIIDSGRPGPVVMLVGGMHGNEPAGYRAAEQIRHWPTSRGVLVVVPALNVPGLEASTRNMPGIENEDHRNANRNFPKTDAPDVAFTPPCIGLWELTRWVRPDWCVDLHEGYDFHISNPDSVGSSVIHFAEDTGELAASCLEAVNATVTDPDRRLVPLGRGSVNGSWLRACHDRLGADTFCFETTYKDQPISTRTRQHRVMTNEVLRAIGMIETDCADHVAPGPGADTTYVGLFDGDGASGRGIDELTALLDTAPGWEVRHIGVADILGGVLDRLDVAVFPGGSGSKQARALGEDGRRRVRDFVSGGGGYVGVCAGAYLCSAHYSWSLGILDAAVYTGAIEVPGEGTKQLWYRGGSTMVDVELTGAGRRALGVERQTAFQCRYHNGPIISPHGDPAISDYRVLAHFRSENWRYQAQEGTMVGAPAIAAGEFGAGRVVAISPHPESLPELHDLILGALAWTTRR